MTALLEEITERIQSNAWWIEGTLERGRANGYPECCIKHFIAHTLVSHQTAAQRYGVLVSEDGRRRFIPCDYHRQNPPRGYRWDGTWATTTKQETDS